MNSESRYREASGTLGRILSVAMLIVGVMAPEAQTPEVEENVVYSIVAFDGRDYTGTFSREDADTLYMIADVDNFVNVKKALVYYWDITQEWRIDLENLDYTFEGRILLTDESDNVEMLDTVRFTYYNAPGEYEINWRVFTGEDADREYAAYSALMREYVEEIRAYQVSQMELQARFEEMIAQLRVLRAEEDEITARLDESPARKRLDEIRVLIEQAVRDQNDTVQLEQERRALERELAPLLDEAARKRLEVLAFSQLAQRLGEDDRTPAPEHPGYVVPEPASAFLINLEPGEYSIRLVLPNGSTLEGSEKRVVVHERRRTNSIGYDVIPADKWTRPVLSQTPASVLYVDGTTDLFLLPYFQDEFNDLYYNKTVRNDSLGNPDIMRWVKTQQVPSPSIEVEYPGNRTESFLEQPFYVEQLPGRSFGYNIVPFEADGAHRDREPNLIAFPIPLDPSDDTIRLRLQGRDGEILPGGEREIRIVRTTGTSAIGLILALLPLVLMAISLIVRTRSMQRFAKLEEREAAGSVSQSIEDE